METAGASEMEADVERKGLGTPATRASIIDKLVSSKYAVRKKRQLIATEAGKQLITVLPDYLKSAQMTADWENRLLMMERGRYDRETFMEGITQMLHRMLDECRQISEEDRQKFGGSGAAGSLSPAHEELGKCPLCGSPVFEGDKTFYCSDRNCSFVLWKQNRYLEKLRTSLNAGMVRDFLAEGKTRSARLYSANKGRYFQADLLMEWKDGRPSYSLEFPGHNAGSNS
jgi:DNA topoisomerase-3